MQMNEDENFLRSEIQKTGITLSDLQVSQFMKFYELLIEKNKVMNLTAITEFKDVVIKHFADSLSILNVLNIGQQMNVIDIGTGAGFPGIPLKILFPNINIVLLDSLRKRVDFLNDCINELEMKNAEAVHARAEEMAHQSIHREKYDLCVSRAVASLPVLCELTLPFVRVNGHFVAYKGNRESTESEISQSENALRVLGAEIEKVNSFSLSSDLYERTLVSIHKVRQISKKYPRKPGIPAKSPL